MLQEALKSVDWIQKKNAKMSLLDDGLGPDADLETHLSDSEDEDAKPLNYKPKKWEK